MGLRDTVLFLLVAVASTRWVGTAAAVGPGVLVAWAIAFVAFFVPLAAAVVELASRFPDEGGIYVWVQRTFGDGPGFMTAWMYWASNLVYFPGLLYATAASALIVVGPRGQALSNSAPYFIGVSLVGLALGFVPNLVGLSVGKRLHNAGAWGTLVPFAMLLVAAGVSLSHARSATRFDVHPLQGVHDLVFLSTLAFAFAGLEVASLMGGEIEDARRVVPRAIGWAGVAIVGFYVFGTVATLVLVAPGQANPLQGIAQPVEVAGLRMGLPWAGPVAAAFITLASLGGVGAWFAAGARLPFVAGLDRRLPRQFGELHPRWGTPATALIVQAGFAVVILLLGQAGATVRAAYDVLVGMAVVVYFVPYLYMFAALVRVQRTPAGPDLARVPGGAPVAVVLGVVGFATTAISMVLAALPARGEAHPAIAIAKVVGGSAVIAVVGLWLYRRSSRA